MATAYKVNEPNALEMFQGESRAFTFTITDSSGNAVDLSSATLRFVVQDSQVPPTGQFKIDAGSQISMDNAATGVIVVTISTTNSATPRPDSHWELWNVASGTDDVLAHGSIVIKPAVKDI